jgi:hypothetical protein
VGGAHETADTARAKAGDALAQARCTARTAGVTAPDLPRGLLSMQRSAGNAAVNALVAAKLKWPGEQAKAELDAGLKQARRDEPVLDVLETGLKRAKSLGVPVDLEGIRPPPSALAVTTTGFGPGTVSPKKAVPPKKPVPKVSPLGKVASRPAAKTGPGKGVAPPAPTMKAGPPASELAPLSGAQLLAPPAPPAHTRPDQDPAFKAVIGNVTTFGKAKKAHPPAASKAKEAQDAALPPADDLAGQAKAAKADTMDAQQAGTFDKKAFIAAVKNAIEAKSPKTLKEADDYKKSGKAGEVKGEIKGLVTAGKDGQSQDIKAATEAAPDTSTAVPKPVTPMGQESPGAPATIPAEGAAPKPAPPEQTNLEAGKHEVNAEMAEGEVSDKQLAESNEPQFEEGLAEKRKAAEHADAAPAEYRKQEQGVIAQNQTEAQEQTAQGVAGMQSSKGAAIAALVAQKGKAKSKDEQRRAEVTAKIQGIFNAAEADVKKILDGIDPKVEIAFEQGEKRARSVFEDFVGAKMSAYKKDRYGGWLGGYRWLRDKIRGMPAKVNEFYVAGRELYLKEMDVVISKVADIVSSDLTAAKQRIAKGRSDIAVYVKSLPKDLRKVGAEASQDINEKFEQLESDVQAKQDSVVDTLATKYVEARKGLDERIEELQAENRGLIDKAIGAIKAIVNTIRELAAMLRNVLSRVAGVVGSIIKAPVKFLGNLIAGVKGGILKFKDNILDHLRKGLMSWLFGALAEGGVELPETFDLKGIVKLLLSIFGLTWRNIRNRLVKQIGEPAMAAIEKGVDIFQKLVSGGVGALWEMLVEKLGDIKEMILEQVKDFVVTKIITAGITWLIGLLNPAAAFIKACKLIYDVVMFFVNNAGRILKFVNTVIDSVADMVRGNVGAVVNKIEDVLGQMVPILIGFLASVIGLGGIGEQIRKIIGTLQKPINKALDFVIKTGLKLAGPIIRGLKSVAGKVKGKIAAGKAWVKGKAEAGKQWVKGKFGLGPKDVKAAAKARVLKLVRDGITAKDLRNRLPGILGELAPQGLKRLELKGGDSGQGELVAEASPLEVLCFLIPEYLKREDEAGKLKPRNASVRMRVTLELNQGVEGSDLSSVRPVTHDIGALRAGGRRRRAAGAPDLPGTATVHPMPPITESGKVVSGGLIAAPAPGATEVHMVTFNTSDDPKSSSNATHAERQFVNWLESRPIRDKITGIKVEINLSPCTRCTADLQYASVLTPNAQGRRTLAWEDPFVREPRPGVENISTTTASLSQLAETWDVKPAQVPGQPSTPPVEDKIAVAPVIRRRR